MLYFAVGLLVGAIVAGILLGHVIMSHEEDIVGVIHVFKEEGEISEIYLEILNEEKLKETSYRQVRVKIHRTKN